MQTEDERKQAGTQDSSFSEKEMCSRSSTPVLDEANAPVEAKNLGHQQKSVVPHNDASLNNGAACTCPSWAVTYRRMAKQYFTTKDMEIIREVVRRALSTETDIFCDPTSWQNACDVVIQELGGKTTGAKLMTSVHLVKQDRLQIETRLKQELSLMPSDLYSPKALEIITAAFDISLYRPWLKCSSCKSTELSADLMTNIGVEQTTNSQSNFVNTSSTVDSSSSGMHLRTVPAVLVVKDNKNKRRERKRKQNPYSTHPASLTSTAPNLSSLMDVPVPLDVAGNAHTANYWGQMPWQDSQSGWVENNMSAWMHQGAINSQNYYPDGSYNWTTAAQPNALYQHTAPTFQPTYQPSDGGVSLEDQMEEFIKKSKQQHVTIQQSRDIESDSSNEDNKNKQTRRAQANVTETKELSCNKQPVQGPRIARETVDIETVLIELIHKSLEGEDKLVYDMCHKQLTRQDVERQQDLFDEVCRLLRHLESSNVKETAGIFCNLVRSEDQWCHVIECILEAGLLHPSIAARLCKHIALETVSKVRFSKLLIIKCECEIERDWKTDLAELRKGAADMPHGDEKDEVTKALEDAEQKARKRMLGIVRFVAELFQVGLLPVTVIHSWLQRLVSNLDNEENLLCFCLLLSTASNKLLEISDKNASHVNEKPLNQYFTKMTAILDMQYVADNIELQLRKCLEDVSVTWSWKPNPDEVTRVMDEMYDTLFNRVPSSLDDTKVLLNTQKETSVAASPRVEGLSKTSMPLLKDWSSIYPSLVRESGLEQMISKPNTTNPAPSDKTSAVPLHFHSPAVLPQTGLQDCKRILPHQEIKHWIELQPPPLPSIKPLTKSQRPPLPPVSPSSDSDSFVNDLHDETAVAESDATVCREIVVPPAPPPPKLSTYIMEMNRKIRTSKVETNCSRKERLSSVTSHRRSTSPVRDKIGSWLYRTRDPHRRSSRSPTGSRFSDTKKSLRHRSRSPSRREAERAALKRSRSPIKCTERERDSGRQRSRSPARNRSREREKDFGRRRSRSPVRRHSREKEREPGRRRSRSPMRRQSREKEREPGRRQSRSPIRRQSREKERESLRRRSRSPAKNQSKRSKISPRHRTTSQRKRKSVTDKESVKTTSQSSTRRESSDAKKSKHGSGSPDNNRQHSKQKLNETGEQKNSTSATNTGEVNITEKKTEKHTGQEKTKTIEKQKLNESEEQKKSTCPTNTHKEVNITEKKAEKHTGTEETTTIEKQKCHETGEQKKSTCATNTHGDVNITEKTTEKPTGMDKTTAIEKQKFSEAGEKKESTCESVTEKTTVKPTGTDETTAVEKQKFNETGDKKESTCESITEKTTEKPTGTDKTTEIEKHKFHETGNERDSTCSSSTVRGVNITENATLKHTGMEKTTVNEKSLNETCSSELKPSLPGHRSNSCSPQLQEASLDNSVLSPPSDHTSIVPDAAPSMILPVSTEETVIQVEHCDMKLQHTESES